jgi:multiple antibiotic resistance protein
MLFEHEAVVLFLALFALYSPVAALSSYLPIVRPFTHAQQVRLAIGLAVNVAVFVLLAIWVGEPLLKLLGISTDALTVTGGIALLYASIPLMRGTNEPSAASDRNAGDVGATGEVGPTDDASATVHTGSLRSVLLTPITFPLTVGGTTFAFGVAAAAEAETAGNKVLLSVAVAAYAVVTGITLYASGHVERRVSSQVAMILDRIAGILLTSIAVMLLANGATGLVLAALDRV